ncbi:MAG: hypothetical protein ACOVP7_03450, partial [Lacibacter sp.]
EQLAYEYPWFSTAHLLVAAKKQQSNVADTEEQLQKAVAYTAKPLWLTNRYKLFSNALAGKTAFAEKETVTADENDAAIDAMVLVEAEDTREKVEFAEDETAFDAAVVLDAEAEIETAKLLEDAETEAAAEAMIAADAEREVADFIEKTDAEFAADAAIETADAQDVMQESINKVITATPAPVAQPQEPVFTFEPFHTVDYFASQGIKLSEDRLGNDMLGSQVKSFTQWLRSMKKIYVEEKKQLDSNEEEKVVNKATESNQQEDVITETMAEVLAKQGRKAQAIDLYSKLSLLHPEKSVYFASRIEELKQ